MHAASIGRLPKFAMERIAGTDYVAVPLFAFMHPVEPAQAGEAGNARAGFTVVGDLRTFHNGGIALYIGQ